MRPVSIHVIYVFSKSSWMSFRNEFHEVDVQMLVPVFVCASRIGSSIGLVLYQHRFLNRLV